MSLTADDARSIADEFLSAAKSIDVYLDSNFNIIRRTEYDLLSETFSTLIRISSSVTTEAVGLSINDLQSPIDTLKGVVSDAKDAIKKLSNVRKVIQFASGLADLGAAIISKTPSTILASVKKLNELKES